MQMKRNETKWKRELFFVLVIVPLLPPTLQKDALNRSHNVPTAGHLGAEKTLERLRHDAFWVNMAKDVEKYCKQCSPCQQSKPPLPQCAPLQNIPIGQPWQMIAVDTLQVPLSTKNMVGIKKSDVS